MKISKRSIDVVKSFCIWDYLLDLVNKCDGIRDRALVSALFETGGRVSEVLLLEMDNFVVHNQYIVIKSMPVLKRYHKIGEFVDKHGRKRWRMEKKKAYRTFPIHSKEPLCLPLVKRLKMIKSGHLFKLSRNQVYRIVNNLDSDVFPNWFRAQRASQLELEYGFDIHDLIDFFNWKGLQTATHYSHMCWKGLANKMKC